MPKPFQNAVDQIKAAIDRHERRARPSGLDCALADRIDFLNPAHWDALAQSASFFMSRDYRRLLETHSPAGMQQRYALVYSQGRPIVAVAAQILEIGGDQLANLPDSKVRRKALEQIRTRLLVCGSLVSSGFHGIAFAAGEPDELLWHGVAEALYRIRRADRLHGQVDYVMIKDLDEARTGAATSLRDFSYRPMQTEPEMAMPIRPGWKRFEDYLADLNSNYRSKARKVIKQVEEAGYRVERNADAAAHDARIHALYTEVESRASTRLSALPQGYFGALSQCAGPQRFRCTLIRNDSEIVGFMSTVKDGDRALGYYVGFDYGVNANVPLYLRLLQTLIEDAIELGCSELSFGRTAAEPKASLGAVAHASHVWLRHRVPAVNALVRGIFGRVQPGEAPERRPFKAAKE
ncbi:GNAT family N-acetyltransferase [Tahibacter amnicola]|uniref:GNAT family N-acetyltransferase n=1 Tax=Tahibacter amnicola TaxID=2976241 RepID=A0ABY6BFN3_9GAMM|nr:GNAT family N-acetyltransferase [Tahibacter amnicola]UXI68684.1 GNAT family N-acetyltransferase [Tahibacter amnicola]